MSHSTDAVRERVLSVADTALGSAPSTWTTPVRLAAGLVAVIGLGTLTAIGSY